MERSPEKLGRFPFCMHHHMNLWSRTSLPNQGLTLPFIRIPDRKPGIC